MGMPYGVGMNQGIDMDGRNSGGASVGGQAGKMLEQNVAVINQIRQNLSGGKIHENTDLIMRFRDNVTSILNSFTAMPGVMSHMPPLPVKLNETLANSFLPPTNKKPGFETKV